MVEGLDMTLDDLIKKNKESGGGDRGNFRARGGGGGGAGGRWRGGSGGADIMSSGPGPTRRASAFGQSRTAPYARLRRASVIGQFRETPYPPPPPPGLWMPETGRVEERRSVAAAAGTKVYVSNLDYKVTRRDIEIIFSDVGELWEHAIHYDWSGRSKGTAEVVFARHSDALNAIKKYNGKLLDRRPIKIETIGGSFVPSAPSTAIDVSLGYQRGAVRSNRREGLQQGGGRGQGGRRNRERAEMVSAEALDADLEKYQQDAMRK